MLTTEEKKFLEHWEGHRKTEKGIFQQFRFAVPIALILAIAFLLNFFTGWYKRANMVANSQFSPMVLIIGIVIISIFCSIFYKKHRWEMNEQRYQELTAKKITDQKQQDDNIISPVVN